MSFDLLPQPALPPLGTLLQQLLSLFCTFNLPIPLTPPLSPSNKLKTAAPLPAMTSSLCVLGHSFSEDI